MLWKSWSLHTGKSSEEERLLGETVSKDTQKIDFPQKITIGGEQALGV